MSLTHNEEFFPVYPGLRPATVWNAWPGRDAFLIRMAIPTQEGAGPLLFSKQFVKRFTTRTARDRTKNWVPRGCHHSRYGAMMTPDIGTYLLAAGKDLGEMGEEPLACSR